jgi:uncharacterized membrane protein HdeD (DUF308 family)
MGKYVSQTNVSKKPKPKPAPPTEAEAKRNRIEKMTLLLYLEGAVAIIVGMVVLSEFLSSGKASAAVWITGAILGGILAVGVVATWVVRRRASE